MQLFLTLRGDNADLPINYRPLIHGAIYRALSADPKASGELHDRPNLALRPAFKGFTFSPLQGAYRVAEQRIGFSGPVALEIRSISPGQIALLYHSFMTGRRLQLGGCAMEIEDCRMEEKRIETTEIRARTLSPAVNYVTGEDGFATYFSPDQEEFFTALVRNAQRKAAFFHVPEDPELRFSLIPGTTPRRQFSSFKKTPIVAWFCEMRITGAPGMLDLLYQTGIGSKNSAGYGMLALKEKEAGG